MDSYVFYVMPKNAPHRQFNTTNPGEALFFKGLGYQVVAFQWNGIVYEPVVID